MNRTYLLLGAAALAAGATRANDPLPATLAISREVSYYEIPTQSPSAATLAVSRETSWYEILTQNPAPSTLAVSREVSGHVNYSLRNVAAAMRIAAGLSSPAELEMQVYNLIADASSDGAVDILDVVAIAQRADYP